jgi:signal peptidase II
MLSYVMKRSYLVLLVLAAVLILDQSLKIYIKLEYPYNHEVPLIGDWAFLHFVENEGMAFGITFGWEYGKLLLSLFRIVMVIGLFWYLRYLIRLEAPLSLLTSVSLITAGAIGNIIDSAFYGLIFTESPAHMDVPATWASAEHPGYGTFLHGKVVDMLYFPIKYIDFPEWLPIWGGETVLFFSPIFNIADAAITCGVLSIFLFQRNFFHEEEQKQNAQQVIADTNATTPEEVEAEVLGAEPGAEHPVETGDNAETTVTEPSETPEKKTDDVTPDQPTA